MSSISEIKHHIKAISDTAKLTRAMHLISSAKMKKAMRAHDQTIEYFDLVRSNIRFILDNYEGEFHSRFYKSHGKHAAYLVIAGDKGMCGGYNQEVLKLALHEVKDQTHINTHLVTFGHMATRFFEREGIPVDASYLTYVENPTLDGARELATELIRRYRADEFEEVFIIYTRLLKGGVTKPTLLHMLPITDETFRDAKPMHTPTTSLEFLPSVGAALDSMVRHYIVGTIYSALVQSFASENRARMSAMDSATRNADEMMQKLKIQLNHARQAEITQEISEIIGGNPDSFTQS